MNERETISVLLSSYNGEKYIQPLIESILDQKCSCNLQLIIRDDGSKDKTIEIIHNIMKNHSNITLHEGTNIGVNASFYELIKIAPKSEYYAIADQDDIWLENKLQVALDAIKNKKVMLYGSASNCVDENLNLIKKENIVKRDITLYNTMIQNFIGGHTQVFTSEFADIIIKNYALEKIYAYDAYFTNVAMIYDALYYDHDSYVNYRLHGNNLVGTGTSFFDWIKKNLKRISGGQGHLYSVQFDYIADVYMDCIDKDIMNEITRFQESRNTFLRRFTYVWKMRFYRQSKKETLIFKLLYLFGGWK